MGFEHISSDNTYASGIEKAIEKEKYECMGSLRITFGSGVDASEILKPDIMDEKIHGVSGTIHIDGEVEAWSKCHARSRWYNKMKRKESKMKDALADKDEIVTVKCVTDTCKVLSRIDI